MVQLKKAWLEQIEDLEATNVDYPKENYKSKVSNSEQLPEWIHFGGGNLYRGMHAEIAQELIDNGQMDNGITVIETFDEEVPDKAYKAYQNQILQVILAEDGSMNKRLLDSTEQALYGNPTSKEEWKRINHFFESPILKFSTFTITEKGYSITKSNGSLLPIIEKDMELGPRKPTHTMSVIASLLYTRYKANELPIAMVTTDNFSRNGEKFKDSILTIAKAWKDGGLVSEQFLDYLENPDKVSFPWSMIDRITPNPSLEVMEQLKGEGFEDLEVIKTSKGTNIAPFVNTEKVHYLVIEDSFPNGRPDLAAGGVLLTDRETVDKADVMKVTTCLNPLHTTLAIYGSILRIPSISEAVRYKELYKLIEKVGYQEGLAVVVDPGIINPREFIDEVVKERFPNPAIPDTPQRIATDTSQKIAIRFGETIRKYQKDVNKDASELEYIPLVLAGWLRYLMAVDDDGKELTLSPDPLLEELQSDLKEFKLGAFPENAEKILSSILSNERIFGVDLYEVGLAGKVIQYYKELMVGPHAVRTTLQKYLK